MGLSGPNSGLFTSPGFIVSPVGKREKKAKEGKRNRKRKEGRMEEGIKKDRRERKEEGILIKNK